MPKASRCLLCGDSKLVRIWEKPLFGATTRADALYPYSALQCRACGHLQKKIDGEWRRAMKHLYERDYRFVGRHVNFVDGKIVSRDHVAAGFLDHQFSLGQTGSLLDIGCGEGTFLEAFHSLKPHWKLSGFEVSDAHKAHVQALSDAQFYSGNLASVGARFDLITMNHVLEHLTDPVGTLRIAASLLKHDGILAVRVPCIFKVHSDFSVLEHCSHFVPQTLAAAAEQAGLTVISDLENLSAIEIGIGCKLKGKKDKMQRYDVDKIATIAHRCIGWTESIPDFIDRNVSEGDQFGIFGVGGTGIWLGTLLKDRLSFFVDEDPAKQNETFANISILHPANVPTNAIVFVTFNNPEASSAIATRLVQTYPHVRFLVPKSKALAQGYYFD